MEKVEGLKIRAAQFSAEIEKNQKMLKSDFLIPINDSNDDVELSMERGEFQVGEQIMPSRFCGQKDDASCFSNDWR